MCVCRGGGGGGGREVRGKVAICILGYYLFCVGVTFKTDYFIFWGLSKFSVFWGYCKKYKRIFCR